MARSFRKRLDQLCPDARIETCRQRGKSEYAKNFKIDGQRYRVPSHSVPDCTRARSNWCVNLKYRFKLDALGRAGIRIRPQEGTAARAAGLGRSCNLSGNARGTDEPEQVAA